MRKRLTKDLRGTSAVEFALIMPVFVALTFGAIEFSLILFTYNAAAHAAWDVTRQLAANQISTSQCPTRNIRRHSGSAPSDG
jgi:Flp pilus assembly protein TadG